MISLRDIARESGFGISTVSMVLSNRTSKCHIKEDTKEKILLTARNMGYIRNEIAAQIRSGKTKTLIVFLPERIGGYLSEVMLHTMEVGAQWGYFLKPYFFHESDDFAKIIENALSQFPAAFFSIDDIGFRFQTLREYSSRTGVPWFSLDFPAECADLQIVFDEEIGIREAVERLVALGHKKVTHFTTDLKAGFARRRLELYRREVIEHGLDWKEELVFHEILSQDVLEVYVKHLLSHPDRPTAITCGSDYLALSLMMALFASGIRIPDEISLIGFGGLKIGRTCFPHLDSIRQPWHELLETAIRSLIDLLDKKQIQPEILLPTSYQRAGTTSTAR